MYFASLGNFWLGLKVTTIWTSISYSQISGDEGAWTCVAKAETVDGAVGQQLTHQLTHQLTPSAVVPKVKLTGTGKMPVMDMRGDVMVPQRCQSLPPGVQKHQRQQQQQQSKMLSSGHPIVEGLPPKSPPLYAVVNKQQITSTNGGICGSKRRVTSPVHQLKQQQQQQLPVEQHNYCNVAPLLGDIMSKPDQHFQVVKPDQVYASVNKQTKSHYYENSREVIARMEATNDKNNYVNMEPNSSKENTPMPLIPFDTVDYNVVEAGLENVDPISIRLRELHDALDNDNDQNVQAGNNPLPGDDFNLSDLAQDLPPPPPEMLLDNGGYEEPAYEALKPVDQVSEPFGTSQISPPTNESMIDQAGQKEPAYEALKPVNQGPGPNVTSQAPSTNGSLMDQDKDQAGCEEPAYEALKPVALIDHMGQMHGCNKTGESSCQKPRGPVTAGCSVTIPRSGKGQVSSSKVKVNMRRSSSVPCKGPVNRGSTSSSDSGFSAGSPTQTGNAAVARDMT